MLFEQLTFIIVQQTQTLNTTNVRAVQIHGALGSELWQQTRHSNTTTQYRVTFYQQ